MIRPRETLPTANPGRSYDRGEDWRDRANCAGTDAEAFFSEGKGGQVPEAVLITCANCPADVVQACLDDALATRDQWAIRGGTTPTQRRRMTPGTVAPILTRPRCKTCGGVTSPRRKKCDGCIETAALDRQTAHRQTVQRTIEESA